jgi:hypothetical protein
MPKSLRELKEEVADKRYEIEEQRKVARVPKFFT